MRPSPVKTVTSIVHHQVKAGQTKAFLAWLERIKAECSKFEGYIDSKLLETGGDENDCISVFRFDTNENLKRWLMSDIHLQMVNELHENIVEKEVKIRSYTGLEYWFDGDPGGRLGMSVLTFIGLLPLVVFVPPFLAQFIPLKGVLFTAFSTAVLVLLMTYAMMPAVMRIKNTLSSLIVRA